MGVAKKEIFNTQFKQIFRPTGCIIKQLFLSFEHFETKFVFFFWGGGEESVFNVLSSHSFFSFCHPFLQPVLLPTLLSFLCAEFWLATFSGKKGKE